MYIDKDEVTKILDVMNKFPDARAFELHSDSSSGIGSVITMCVHTSINGLDGQFTVEISGVENW